MAAREPDPSSMLGPGLPFADSSAVPHLVMPLGGIGTGGIGLAADGGLRQWQLHNIGNHAGSVPSTFFALRLCRWEPPLDELRVLQAAHPASPTGTPLVSDDDVPDWQRELLDTHPGMPRVEARGLYPVTELRYTDPDLPLGVTLEAFNPLVPGQVDDSSVPAALFTFRLTNLDRYRLHGWLGGAVQNAVGWDGVSPVDGLRGAGYGGNTNRVRRTDGWTRLVLDNVSLPEDAPGAGQLVYATDDAMASALPQWRHPAEFLTFLRSRALASGAARLTHASGTADPQRHAPRPYTGASLPGETWNAGLAVPFDLEPGGERVVRLALTWHFPNRYVDFEQFGPEHPEWGRSRFWLGNHYATRFADAEDVLDHVRTDWPRLRKATADWVGTLASSALDDVEAVHLAAQLTTLRSPTCFRSADGRFFGFEGVLGASTGMWSGAVGGSCPLNCTHVWNYEQALARVWPELERDMRDTEFDVMQAPDGYVPHRVIVPTYLPQLWDVAIGGPEQPALDGMLGTVLKTYREVRAGAGLPWLVARWPRVLDLLDHVERGWADPDGMLVGVQPSTHDIDLAGLNSFQGSLWLAALRAAGAMASLVGDDASAARFQARCEQASAAYDTALFTGEYYAQVLQPGDAREFQWEDGCLSDQLIGQWWAHQLDLGHVLPADHVRTALRAVVAHNLRHGFADFAHPFRVFADGTDTGLLMCSWPHGGRPDVPTRYADEVWTGSEYQVAAHCLREGLRTEGHAVLAALWARYDGTRRNPYNEIECGDHYVRSMAGWSVLDAFSGFDEDAVTGSLSFDARPDRPGPLPFVCSTGFGTWTTGAGRFELRCTGGTLRLARLRIRGATLDAAIADADVHGDRITFATPRTLSAGGTFAVDGQPGVR